MHPIPAAAVILLREGPGGPEVLLVKRSASSPFMPSRHVFPGGTLRQGESPEIGAIRELWEEAGVVLATGHPWPDPSALERARQGLSREGLERTLESLALVPAVEELVAYSVWTTPPARSRRFCTTFFLALMPHGQHPSADQREVAELVWRSPGDALCENLVGGLRLAPPQVRILAELGVAGSVEELMAAAVAGDLVHVEPVMWVGEDGTRVVLLPWDKDYNLGRPSGSSLGRAAQALKASRLVCIKGRWLPYLP